MELQLIEINERGFVVRKDGELIRFSFIEDYGDCCGFNLIGTHLFISKNELRRNPIITNIQEDNTRNDGSDNLIITFFGEKSKLQRLMLCLVVDLDGVMEHLYPFVVLKPKKKKS